MSAALALASHRAGGLALLANARSGHIDSSLITAGSRAAGTAVASSSSSRTAGAISPCGGPHEQQQLRLHPQRQRSRPLHIARAEPPSSSSNTSSSDGEGPATPPAAASSSSSLQDESEVAFLLKLLAFSVAGAAAIKYGSLLLALPFEPNPAVALAVVLGTPIGFSLFLLAKGQGGRRE